MSDHLPLLIELCPLIELAQRRFIVNTRLLRDEEIVEILSEKVDETSAAMQDQGGKNYFYDSLPYILITMYLLSISMSTIWKYQY